MVAEVAAAEMAAICAAVVIPVAMECIDVLVPAVTHASLTISSYVAQNEAAEPEERWRQQKPHENLLEDVHVLHRPIPLVLSPNDQRRGGVMGLSAEESCR